MELTNESKTLFIPLLGKAEVSKNNVFLYDPKAEEILSNLDYDFRSLKQSKWLFLYMSLRSLIIDELCNKYISENSNLIVIHLGCGLDSRCLRVNQGFKCWYDLDFQNVIDIREKFYSINSKYKMIGSSVLDFKWLDYINDCENVLIVMEGLTMYLSEKEIKDLINQLSNKFKRVHLIFDAYSKKGVKLSKIKNPVKKMNANIKFGIDKKEDFLLLNDKLKHFKTHLIKKDDNKLAGLTKFIFNNLYCGKISQSLYKIYEFDIGDSNEI